MSMFHSFDINASGLTAEQYRMDIISGNIANANTTRTEDGTPYRRKVVTFTEKGNRPSFSQILERSRRNVAGTGVKVDGVHEDNETEMRMVYDPAHPDADENGYVTLPNVNIITEMTNLIDASRGWDANNTAFTTSNAIAMKGLEIGSNS